MRTGRPVCCQSIIAGWIKKHCLSFIHSIGLVTSTIQQVCTMYEACWHCTSTPFQGTGQDDPCQTSIFSHVMIAKIVLSWLPVHIKCLHPTWSGIQKYHTSIKYKCSFFTVLFVILLAVKFSQWIGIGSWGWPSHVRLSTWHILHGINNKKIYKCADNVGNTIDADGMHVVRLPKKKEWPSTQLLTPGAPKGDASLWMLSIMSKVWHWIVASGWITQ